MQKKLLTELLHDLEQEMIRLGYSEGTMKFYRRRWKSLLQFAEDQETLFYSEQLGIDFLETHFNIFEKNFEQTLSQKDTQELRVIRMIGDFQLHQTILRRYYKHKKILTDSYFIEISQHFKQYCTNKDYSKVTINHYVKQSARFMDYLSSQKVVNFKNIDLSLINQYIKTLAGYSYKTIEQNICSMRCFFRFLLEIGEVTTDFASKTPMIQARKQTRIPSVWTMEELKKLIAVIDKGSPQGKRDYTIILLACRLGMRCKDIKNLKIENFRWKEKEIVFTQSKTRDIQSLPLPSDVGWAVIDYFKYGRPQIDSPYVFVKHIAPFGPFSEENRLNQIIKKYMVLAHIPTSKKKRGMHSLRHTMASVLLEKETPLSTISEILGHADIDSTAVYLKVNIDKLRECSLDFSEVSKHE